ncbi:hypothetical protein VP01_3782g2 [Puccinia sorghi]|uniref:Uncharacterized protein n=1 Tax=Puccinia sorghi TaxID=27349 RepID=A0A0L6UTL4_9BASI|nr:hypothetical protein VP01_3782g2 [Puccinia sorghi]
MSIVICYSYSKGGFIIRSVSLYYSHFWTIVNIGCQEMRGVISVGCYFGSWECLDVSGVVDPSKRGSPVILVTTCECFQGVLTNLGSFSILLRQVLLCCHISWEFVLFLEICLIHVLRFLVFCKGVTWVVLCAGFESELIFLFLSQIESSSLLYKEEPRIPSTPNHYLPHFPKFVITMTLLLVRPSILLSNFLQQSVYWEITHVLLHNTSVEEMDRLPFARTSNGADTNPMEVYRGAGAGKEDPELECLLTAAQGEETGPDLGSQAGRSFEFTQLIMMDKLTYETIVFTYSSNEGEENVELANILKSKKKNRTSGMTKPNLPNQFSWECRKKFRDPSKPSEAEVSLWAEWKRTLHQCLKEHMEKIGPSVPKHPSISLLFISKCGEYKLQDSFHQKLACENEIQFAVFGRITFQWHAKSFSSSTWNSSLAGIILKHYAQWAKGQSKISWRGWIVLVGYGIEAENLKKVRAAKKNKMPTFYLVSVHRSIANWGIYKGVETGDNPPVGKPLASPRGGYRIITLSPL